MTDGELDDMQDQLSGGDGVRAAVAIAPLLIAEVRRLRRLGAVVPYVGRPPAWRTGEELDRLEAAERLADLAISDHDYTQGSGCEKCVVFFAASDAYRKTKAGT